MRDYIVTVFGEKFRINAPDGDFNLARRLGAKAYLRDHPGSKFKITALVFSGNVKVRVANDRRVKFEDLF